MPTGGREVLKGLLDDGSVAFTQQEEGVIRGWGDSDHEHNKTAAQ
jgi:hypothetical protein